MICLGKSYWNSQREQFDNKENVDQNNIKIKQVDKSIKNLIKEPALLKKVSEAPTNYSNQPDVDSFGENLKKQYT